MPPHGSASAARAVSFCTRLCHRMCVRTQLCWQPCARLLASHHRPERSGRDGRAHQLQAATLAQPPPSALVLLAGAILVAIIPAVGDAGTPLVAPRLARERARRANWCAVASSADGRTGQPRREHVRREPVRKVEGLGRVGEGRRELEGRVGRGGEDEAGDAGCRR